ncbi:MAG: ATP phosphoribosyltransferase regulatory subunit [Rickettsiales bacterium]
MNNYLLPSGFRDLLPPDARREQMLMGDILNVFHRFGYVQVSPPFMEFEETLLSGKGKSYDPFTFRVMDPMANKMMGIRADMTMQVTRIAAARLANSEKPLRLSYAGRVLRVQTDGLSSDRQLSQAGIELIGSASPAADAEIILAIVEALKAVGHTDLVLDISLGGLMDKILGEARIADAEKQTIRDAVKEKNSDRLNDKSITSHTVKALLQMTYAPTTAMDKIVSLDLPSEAKVQVAAMKEAIAAVRAAAPDLQISLDPLEVHGFDYHDGLCFSVFLKASRIEVGRGGRYLMEDAEGNVTPAAGATLYLRALMQAANKEGEEKTYVPFAFAGQARALRETGMIAIVGLEAEKDVKAEAKRLGCTQLFDGTKTGKI